MQLLLFLQQSLPSLPIPTTSSIHFSPSAHVSSRRVSLSQEEMGDLDLPLYDTLSHSHYYYNQNQSIIYSQGNALDLLYETTIDSTIRKKESLHADMQLPREWTELQLSSEAVFTPQSPNISEDASGAIHSPVSPVSPVSPGSPESPESVNVPEVKESCVLPSESSLNEEIPFPEDIPSKEEVISKQELVPGEDILSIHSIDETSPGEIASLPRQEYSNMATINSYMSTKVHGFTLLQAVQFLLENSSSRAVSLS